MKELSSNPKALKSLRPPGAISPEAGALNTLLATLNNPNITGAVVPEGDGDGATVAPPDPAVVASRPQAAVPRPPAPRAITASKFAFTGRLKAGKDYVAAAIGAKIFGFADPLYALQDHFFGTSAVTNPKHKDIAGARQFLQTIGQWGWGAVNDKYPLAPARAVFTTMIRTMGESGVFPAELKVDWANFGKVQTLWVDAALARIDAFLEQHPESRIAIVNARFVHEFEPLKTAGFEHYHVMCSSKTWTARIAKAGLKPDSAAVKDISEQLGHALDQDAIKKISAQKNGPMLKVIWNDELVPSPSPRFYTLASFLQATATDPLPAAGSSDEINYAAE
jgi:hypothetical protein